MLTIFLHIFQFFTQNFVFPFFSHENFFHHSKVFLNFFLYFFVQKYKKDTKKSCPKIDPMERLFTVDCKLVHPYFFLEYAGELRIIV